MDAFKQMLDAKFTQTQLFLAKTMVARDWHKQNAFE